MFPAAPSVFVVVCIRLSLLCREAAKIGCGSAKPTIKLCFRMSLLSPLATLLRGSEDRMRLGIKKSNKFVFFCSRLWLLCCEAAKIGFVSAKPTIKLCFLFVSALAFGYFAARQRR